MAEQQQRRGSSSHSSDDESNRRSQYQQQNTRRKSSTANESDEDLAHRLQYQQHGNRRKSSTVRILSSTFKGRLQIDIVEAHLNRNYGFLKMDPYVRMLINNNVYETTSDYSGAKSPQWNKRFLCYIEEQVDDIKFEIFDHKSFKEDKLIAVASYKLPESLFVKGFIDEWLPLSGKLGEEKEGELNIHVIFTSTHKIQEFERRSSQPTLRDIEGFHQRLHHNERKSSLQEDVEENEEAVLARR